MYRRTLLTIILTTFVFILGLIGVIVAATMSFPPSFLSNLMWLGMCFICFSLAGITLTVYTPWSSPRLFLRIILPIISLGGLVAVYFIFKELLFSTYARYDGDTETIHIAIVTSVGTGVFLTILFMLFKYFNKAFKAYGILIGLSIPIAFISMAVGNLIHIVAWAAIIESGQFVAYAVAAIICIGFPVAAANPSGSSDVPTIGDRYRIEGSDRELEYIGGGRYRDNYGNIWESDDGGETVHRT